MTDMNLLRKFWEKNLNFKGEEYETIGSDSRQTERRKIDFV